MPAIANHHPVTRICPFLLALALLGCGRVPAAKPLTPLWTAPIASTDTPLLGKGAIYVRGYHAGHKQEDAHVYALEAASGKELWASEEVPDFKADMRLTQDDKLIVSENCVLDAKTGRLLYRSAPMIEQRTQKVASPSRPKLGQWSTRDICLDNVVYFVDPQHRLNAAIPGKSLWKVSTPMPKGVQNGLLAWANEQILVLPWPAAELTINAHDRKTGKLLWTAPLKSLQTVDLENVQVQGSTLLLQGSVRAEKDGATFLVPQLLALDAQSGKEKWRYAPCQRLVQVGQTEVWVTQDLGLAETEQQKSSSARLNINTGAVLWKKDWPTLGVVDNGLDWLVSSTSWPDLAGEYTGDKRGSKNRGGGWGNANLFKSSLQGVNLDNHQVEYATEVWPATQMCARPALAEGVLYVATLAEMKEGHSGVSAYRVPAK